MTSLKQMLLLDKNSTRGLLRAVIACTLTSFSLMLPFTITLQVIAEILKPLNGGTADWNRLWILFGIGLAVFVVIFLFSKFEYQKTYGNSYQQSESARLRTAEQMRRLPMSFFNSKDLTELSGNLMSDCTNIEQTMSNAIPQLIANIISITVICAALAFYEWRLALAVFLSLPVSFFIFWISRRMQARLFQHQVETKLNASKQTQEYLEGIKVIRSCGLGGSRFQQLDEAFLELKRSAIRVELGTGSVLAVASMVLRAGTGITVFVSTLLLTGGQVTFLTVLMFLLLAVRIYGPVLTVLTLLPDLLYLQISSQRLRMLMETPVMPGSDQTVPQNFDITFCQVGFHYNQEEVLKDITFAAPEGKITALAGPSGSGKSTIAKLAARFWDPQKGQILIGGRDISTLDPEYLMRCISFVFQDVTLFNDTIEENIRIGNPDATLEQIHAAAKAAYCDEFVMQLPDGYQTLLGENGGTLSGGERQRISIARALLKNAPIVLLDEATASLDPENEVLVQQALGRLTTGKTVLVIAHRLRTIADADHIVVLADGRIAEQGTHEELIQKNGLYHKMTKIQQKNAAWRIGRIALDS